MDFALDRKHEIARSLFRDFAESEVKLLAQEIDEEEHFPVEAVGKMVRYDFLGIPTPKEYGDQGCDVPTYAMCVEELSKACGTTGVIVSAHTSLCINPILTYGTEEQKQKYLPDLTNSKGFGALGPTEPGAGTDAQGQQIGAVLDDDEWVLNSSKYFIMNDKYTDVCVIIAVIDTAEKRGKRMKKVSALIVEKKIPGSTFGVKEKKMGIRISATYEFVSQGCRIPKNTMPGQKGKGPRIAMYTLDGDRTGIASQALDLTGDALERTVTYVKERKQLGRAIAAFQNTQLRLVDMAMDCGATQFLVYRVAVIKQTQTTYGVEAVKAKLFAANTTMSVTTKCAQLHGGYGCIREYNVERMVHDVKITEICEGTSEVQRMIISASLLKQSRGGTDHENYCLHQTGSRH